MSAATLPDRLGPTFRSLGHRNYRLYFFGQVVSLTGTWAQVTALQWMAYESTGLSVWPALFSAAQVAPTLLLGQVGGWLADRTDRRRLILRTQTAFLAVTVVLTAVTAAGAGPGLLLALVAVNGVIHALDFPARLAFLNELVPRDDLGNAVALNSLLFNAARAAGPALGGVALAAAGPAACFAVNAVSFAAVLWALALMRPGAAGWSKPAARAGAGGVSYLLARPRLGLVLVAAGLVALAGWPMMALLPALACRVGGAAGAYSQLLAAVGAGALAAALLCARFGAAGRRGAFLAGGAALTAAGLALLSQAQSLAAAAACCSACGAGLVLFFATGQTALQLGVDDAVRGRVMGLWAVTLSAGSPAGNLLFGGLADARGLGTALLCEAVVCALVAVAVVGASARGRGDPGRLSA